MGCLSNRESQRGQIRSSDYQVILKFQIIESNHLLGEDNYFVLFVSH